MSDRRAFSRPYWLVPVLFLAAVCLAQVPLAAQGPPPPPPPPTKWTVLAYMDGDNNLDPYAVTDVDEMENAMRAFLPPDADPIQDTSVRVLVQLDRLDDGYGTHRFELFYDEDADDIGNLASDAEDLGMVIQDEADMGSPGELASFIVWGVEKAPADHYMLILWDHGDGWRRAGASIPRKGLLYDDHGTSMSIAALQDALGMAQSMLSRPAGPEPFKLDVLVFDECLMGTAEVAYAMKDYAKVMVATEELEPATGPPYTDFISALYDIAGSEPTLSPEKDVASTFVGYYVGAYAEAQSAAIDLSQMDRFAAALSNFSEELVTEFYNDPSGMLPVYLQTWWSTSLILDLAYMGDTSTIDLGSFVVQAMYRAPDPNLRARAAELYSVMMNSNLGVVVANYNTGYPSNLHHGLSIYYPCNLMPDEMYYYTDLAMDTSWDSFIHIAPLGVALGYAPDAYEPDGGPETATPAQYYDGGGYRGRHWFYFKDDTDTFAFEGTRGDVYAMGVADLGPWCFPRMYLLDQNGAIILSSEDWEGGHSIVWRCPADGTYYLAVVQSDQNDGYILPPPSSLYGGLTYYEVWFTRAAGTDYDLSPWASREISACYLTGLVHGYQDGSFKPYLPVTRDQMATFLARAVAGDEANIPDYTGAPSFGDVDAGNWAYKYIEYCKARGLISGFADGNFRPRDPITRAQLAAFLARALAGGEAKVPAYTPAMLFPDVSSDFWAAKYINYLWGRHVVKGYRDHTYKPTALITRDQMTVFLYNAFLKPTELVPLPAN